MLPLVTSRSSFPHPSKALKDPDGLLAYSFELTTDKIVKAYQQGIFPWYSQDDPVLWWSPSQRAVLRPQEFKPAKSLRKHVKKHSLAISFDQHTEEVIRLCATSRGKENTWITDEMQQTYICLAKQGVCHSIEVKRDGQLIGGLYGLILGQVFCGESMFSLESNASKVAFWSLCHYFTQCGGQLIDCQLENPHLTSLGVGLISRDDFLKQLQQFTTQSLTLTTFDTPF